MAKKNKAKTEIQEEESDFVENKEIKDSEIKEDLPESKLLSNAILTRESAIADSDDLTRELYDKTRYGEPIDNKKFQYSLVEALYLMERGKLRIVDAKEKEVSFDNFVKNARKIEPNFWIRYVVFKDLRKRGYIVKTALKFGADFRVYDRGIKPGEDHARWIVFPVSEVETLTWHKFSAMNRVAHSTRKRLLVGVVDSEGDCTFYEIRWLRP